MPPDEQSLKVDAPWFLTDFRTPRALFYSQPDGLPPGRAAQTAPVASTPRDLGDESDRFDSERHIIGALVERRREKRVHAIAVRAGRIQHVQTHASRRRASARCPRPARILHFMAASALAPASDDMGKGARPNRRPGIQVLDRASARSKAVASRRVAQSLRPECRAECPRTSSAPDDFNETLQRRDKGVIQLARSPNVAQRRRSVLGDSIMTRPATPVAKTCRRSSDGPSVGNPFTADIDASAAQRCGCEARRPSFKGAKQQIPGQAVYGSFLGSSSGELLRRGVFLVGEATIYAPTATAQPELMIQHNTAFTAARIAPASVLKSSPIEGVGNAGCRAPSSVQKCTVDTSSHREANGETRQFPHAMVLTAYSVLFPGDEGGGIRLVTSLGI